MNRSILVLTAFLVTTGAAPAQSEAVLGRDDAGFARALLDAGYPELAEGLCNLMIKTGRASAGDLVAVQALALDIQLVAVREEADPAKRTELLTALLASKEKFVQENSNSNEGQIAQESLPEVYAALGDALTDQMKVEQDPAKLAKLQQEGNKIFEKAEQQLTGRIYELQEKLDAVDFDSPEEAQLTQEHMLASYNLAKTFYYHGQGDPQGMGGYYLGKAVEAFELFGLDYSDTFQNYQGQVFMGLANKALGNTDDALDDFDEAIALREWLEPDKSGRYPLEAGDADLVAWATQQKMILLRDESRHEEAVAAADDYLDKTIDPLGKVTAVNEYGCRVLALKAECQNLNGDVEGTLKTAQLLVDFDPEGPWGNLGREILGDVAASGRGSSANASELLKIAGSLLESRSFDKAIKICQLAKDQAVGTAEEAEVGSRASFMMGQAFERQDWLHEASMSYDASYESYPQASSAVEGLYRAVEVYQTLSTKERRSFYRQRFLDKRRILAERYPDHPLATRAQLMEGQELEDERKFQEAADFYLRVPQSSPNYAASRFRAGRCFWELAREAEANKDDAGVATNLTKALQHLNETRSAAAKGIDAVLDAGQQRNFKMVDFDALSLIARIDLKLNKANEVLTMLSAAEKQYADDAESMGQLYSLRVQTLDDLDRVDEAVELLEGLLLRDKDAPGVATAAGELARSLDQRASKLLEEDPADPRIDDLWRKAARYYMEQARQLVAQNRITPSVGVGMAGRLLQIGARLNGVPPDRISFIGWSGQRGAQTDLWEEAVVLFRAAINVELNYQASVSLGRTLGFLGRWSEAAPVYAQLFDQEKVYDRATKRFDSRLLAAKPELFLAYLEWGVAEHLAGLELDESARLTRAHDIFAAVNGFAKQDSANAELWWWSKYYLIRNLYEDGQYDSADVGMNDLERRTTQEDWKKHGLDTLLKELKDQIKKKIRRPPPPPD